MISYIIESFVFIALWFAVLFGLESLGVTSPGWYALAGGLLATGFRGYLDIKTGGLTGD